MEHTGFEIGYRSASGPRSFDACCSVLNATLFIEHTVEEWITEAAEAMRSRFTRPGRFSLGYWPKGRPDQFVLVGVLKVQYYSRHGSSIRCSWHP
ncbi:MAG: hypothetical protein ABIH67_00040, partial [Candidatus Uhrbacteria bacterium]